MDLIDLKNDPETGIGSDLKRYISCGRLLILNIARRPDQERVVLVKASNSLGSDCSIGAKLAWYRDVVFLVRRIPRYGIDLSAQTMDVYFARKF